MKKSDKRKKTRATASKRPKSALAPKRKSGVSAQRLQRVPAILSEGDHPAAPPPSGPGRRYALGGAPGEGTALGQSEAGSLPESYGTKRIFLTARDPQWLYAHWDLTREQQSAYNRASSHRHLVLRVYKEKIAGKPHKEIHVHPESRQWLVHVVDPATHYVGVLGYYQPSGRWVTISKSTPATTPPESVSEDRSFQMETRPMLQSLEQVVEVVQGMARTSAPLQEVIQRLRAEGHAGLPARHEVPMEPWTPEQERALARVISMDAVRRICVGSLDITELVRRYYLPPPGALHFGESPSGEGPSPEGWPAEALAGEGWPAGEWNAEGWSGSLPNVSSPAGPRAEQRPFWFAINAELILYGATEPSAQVTLAGRPIRLRADGTFSLRFALPDGDYELPAEAISADGSETRSVRLRFQRATHYQTEVGVHPSDPTLKPPDASPGA